MRGGKRDIRKVRQIKFSGNNPMETDGGTDEEIPELTDGQKRMLRQMSATVKAYIKAAKELLEGKYAGIRDLAPIHLADPGNVLVTCCQDGVVIRYERKTEEERILTVWSPIQIPMLSQNVIHCYQDIDYPIDTKHCGIRGPSIWMQRAGTVASATAGIRPDAPPTTAARVPRF